MFGNVDVYEIFGISKRFPIKPLQFLLIVPILKLALSAKYFIYYVGGMLLKTMCKILIYFIHLPYLKLWFLSIDGVN